MRLNNIVLVSIFLLAILSISAVSSSDEFITNETLSTDDVNSDVIGQSFDIEQIINQSDEDILKESDDSDVSLWIYDSVNVDESYSTVIDVFDGNYLNGTVWAKIDDVAVLNQTFSEKDEDMLCSLTIRNLNDIPSFGTHKVLVKYFKNNVDQPFTMEKNVDFTYSFRIEIDGESADEFMREYNSNINLNIILPDYSKGTLTLKFNGKTYKLNVKNGRAEFKLSLKGLKIDTYILEAKFIDSSNKYSSKTIKVPIKVCPFISCHENVAVGEKDTILIITPKGTPVSVSIYENKDGVWGKNLGNFSDNSGLFHIPLEKINLKSGNELYLNYTAGNIKYYLAFYVFFIKNSNGFKSSISKTGDSVKVIMTGPKSSDEVEIYVDNVLVKYLSFKKGKISSTISDLSVGKHKINVKLMGSKFYSNTFFVTVKAKDKVSLTLNKIKIKKSAKKLVLKATLKINKKTKKGLKVTFKFNGKKYTAKTNKKGVAKYTIKKKVLKKLKVGKKVTYQVKYSFKTVKKTAKVKR